MLWLSMPESSSAPPNFRADALRLAGNLDAARTILDAAVPRSDEELADIEQSRFEVDFVGHAKSDFGPWRSSLSALGPSTARAHLVDMAIYQAALDLGKSRDWSAGLKQAYAELGPFPISMKRWVTMSVWFVTPALLGIGLTGGVAGTVGFLISQTTGR